MKSLEREQLVSQNRYLVKVSGDLVEGDSFYQWLNSVNNHGDYFLIIAGGGTAITQKLTEAGINWEFGENGREIKDNYGKKLAREVLMFQKAIVEDQVKKLAIDVDVIIPVVDCAGEIIHVNGDEAAKNLSPYFSKTYVVTLNGRVKSLSNERTEVVYLDK